MKRAYADIPEGQMHYRIEGNGEPLLLLHSALGSSVEYARVIPFLSKAYCAIAPDFLGQGDSDPTPHLYQIPDHARTIAAFMGSLGIQEATIVGHHNGAMVATELAIASPHLVNSVVLSSIPLWETEGGKAVIDPPGFTAQVDLKADGSHLTEWWRRVSLWGDRSLEEFEARVLDYVKAGPRGEEMHWIGRAYDAIPRLPLVRCPTLVLSATYDPFCAVAEEVKTLVSNSTLSIIGNGPIDVDRMMPREFSEAILSFLGRPVA